MACKRCGQCCINNGLIPPLNPYGEEDAPEWLWTLVRHLRADVGDIAEDYPCVFLTDDMRCAIHDMAHPQLCREFLCDQPPEDRVNDFLSP